jgi:ABC-type branched-subunit amino acid transport system substrate-binding protein
MLGFQSLPLFFNGDEAQTTPQVGLFQQWVKRTDANLPLDQFALYGWAEAVLFVQALKAAGPRATRAGLMNALKGIHQFDADGLIGASDPAGKVPTHCYILWQVHGGQYARVDTPATGYRCDGGVAGG